MPYGPFEYPAKIVLSIALGSRTVVLARLAGSLDRPLVPAALVSDFRPDDDLVALVDLFAGLPVVVVDFVALLAASLLDLIWAS